jgi:hypothetical protein
MKLFFWLATSISFSITSRKPYDGQERCFRFSGRAEGAIGCGYSRKTLRQKYPDSMGLWRTPIGVTEGIILSGKKDRGAYRTNCLIGPSVFYLVTWTKSK